MCMMMRGHVVAISLSMFFSKYPSVSDLFVLLNRQKQLEFRGQLVLRIQSIREIDPSDPAVCVDLNAQCLHIIGPVRSSREIRQIELDLIPSVIQPHRHRANERLDPRRGLIIRCSKSSPHSLVVLDLYLERKVLLHVLYDHHQKWQLYAQCLGR